MNRASWVRVWVAYLYAERSGNLLLMIEAKERLNQLALEQLNAEADEIEGKVKG